MVVHGISRVGLARESIFENEGGDAARAQVAGDVVTFVVGPQLAMPSARRDDDGGSGGLLFRRKVWRDRRVVNVRHDALAVLGYAHGLLPRFAFGTGRAIWPEWNLFRLVRRQNRRGQ